MQHQQPRCNKPTRMKQLNESLLFWVDDLEAAITWPSFLKIYFTGLFFLVWPVTTAQNMLIDTQNKPGAESRQVLIRTSTNPHRSPTWLYTFACLKKDASGSLSSWLGIRDKKNTTVVGLHYIVLRLEKKKELLKRQICGQFFKTQTWFFPTLPEILLAAPPKSQLQPIN